jgi:hypothetical protein
MAERQQHMNPNFRTSQQYDDRSSQAVKKVLLELGQILGDYWDSLVLVGGAVPWLLLQDAEEAHVGTVDVDLVLNPQKLQQEARYAALVQLLEQAGYQRQAEGIGTFQLRKHIDVDDNQPVTVMLDLLKPNKPKTKKNRPALIPDFRVQDIEGAELAFENPTRLRLEGTMPDGRNNSVELPVINLPNFLVMKGFALGGRDKPKDAYDIYYVVRYFPNGIEALAALCQPLLGNPTATKGWQIIAEKFAQPNGYGAQSVAFFLSNGSAQTAELAQIQRDAFEQVQAWLRAIGLVV